MATSIISDSGTQFISKLWINLHKELGTKLDFSTAFHPQIDEQSECNIRCLKIY